MNNGLNGAFGRWLKKAIKSVVSAASSGANVASFGLLRNLITQIESSVSYVIDDLTQGDFFQRPALVFETTEPTKSEEIILDNWLDNKFTPFFSNMVFAIDTAFASNNLQTQISAANAQLLKMKVLREYYVLNETNGLSQNAVSLRMNLINELFNTLDQIIVSKLGTNTTSILVTANQNDFGNLLINSVQGQKHNVKQYSQTVANTTEIVKTNPTKATTNFDVPVRTTNDLLPVFQDTTIQPDIINNDEIKDQEPVKIGSSIDVDKTFKYMSYTLIGVAFIGLVKSLLKRN